MSKSNNSDISPFILEIIEEYINENRRTTKVNLSEAVKISRYKALDHLDFLVSQKRIKSHKERSRGKIVTYYYALTEEYHNPAAFESSERNKGINYPSEKVRRFVQQAVSNITEAAA